ncbi:MAG: hypothetical protein H6742_12480 [Alphaproteobacteria bacterium]|nr:hypothetical protein [Alphaproteobacteria bacterium]
MKRALCTMTMAALAALAALAPTAAQAGGFGLDRLEILSEDSGAWLNYELPMVAARPAATGVRFLTQVQATWYLPVDGLVVGTSLESQSIALEKSFNVDLAGGDFGWYGGVHSRLFLPRGLMAGLDWRKDKLRLSAGASLTNASTWRRPSLRAWSVLPTLGVSILFHEREKPKRYRGKPEDRSQFRTDGVDPLGRPYEGAAPTDPPPTEQPASEVPAGEVPAGEAVTPGAVELPRPDGEPTPGAVELPRPDDEAPDAPATPGPDAAPTGPTQVDFGGPQQVVLPGDDPVDVVIGGGEETQGNDSSQDGDE